MNDFNSEDIEDVLGPLSDMMKKSSILEDVMLPPSLSYEPKELVKERIIHLLRKVVLNSSEITLLGMLLQYNR